MFKLASLNMVELASLNMVELASLNMIELTSMNMVERFEHWPFVREKVFSLTKCQCSKH